MKKQFFLVVVFEALIFATMLHAGWGEIQQVYSLAANDPDVVIDKDNNTYHVVFINYDDVNDHSLYYGKFSSEYGKETAELSAPEKILSASEFGLNYLYNPTLRLDGEAVIIITGGSPKSGIGKLLGTRREDGELIKSEIPLDNFTLEDQGTENFSYFISSVFWAEEKEIFQGAAIPFETIDLVYTSKPPEYLMGKEKNRYVKGKNSESPQHFLGKEEEYIIPNEKMGLWFVHLSAFDFSLTSEPVYLTGPSEVGWFMNQKMIKDEEGNYITPLAYFMMDPPNVYSHVLMIKYNVAGDILKFKEITEDISGGDPSKGVCIPDPSLASDGEKIYLTWDARSEHEQRNDIWYGVYDLNLEEVQPPINLTEFYAWDYDAQHLPKILYKENEEMLLVYLDYDALVMPRHISLRGYQDNPSEWIREEIYDSFSFPADEDYSLVRDEDGGKGNLFFSTGNYLYSCQEN